MSHGPRLAYSEKLHREKYRQPEETFQAAMQRIAHGLADNSQHESEFLEILLHQRFLPAGRIQSAIGADKQVTAFNCFVGGTIPDSFTTRDNEHNSSIMDRAREAAQTMRLGGGIGNDFSTLRPRGDRINKINSSSSGPIEFMKIFDAIGNATSSTGERRGAQMGVLRIDHPDILEFINAKQDNTTLSRFNISVAVTDEFFNHLEQKSLFPLQYRGKVYKHVDAEEIWEKLMNSTWHWAEPGVIFIDRVNYWNNLHYCETISATNPCFTGDTKVWTDKGPKTFFELVKDGKDVKVLTQKEDRTLVYRWMKNPRKTQENVPLLEITIKSTSTKSRTSEISKIRCTPEHIFYLSDGSKRMAKDLSYGISLESAYRYRANSKGYLKIRSQMEHHIPFENIEGLGSDGRNHKVLSIKHLNYKEDVYCGTVDETGKFFIVTGDGHGVLVSNCAEQSLPPYGACLLGSYNLTKYVKTDATGVRYFDWDLFMHDIPIVTRAVDNIIDRTIYPLPEQEIEAKNKRRMGIGGTGLANTAEALGFAYGSQKFLAFEEMFNFILTTYTYLASTDLAAEKGSFKLYDQEKYTSGNFIRTLPMFVQQSIKKNGIRNSHLISWAPTGTISMTADNVSSSLEPVYQWRQKRPVELPGGKQIVDLYDYGFREWQVRGKRAANGEVTAKQHVDVLVTAQRFTDSAISKTVNCDQSMEWKDFKGIYLDAYNRGAKGCTTFNKDGQRFGLFKQELEPDDLPFPDNQHNLQNGEGRIEINLSSTSCTFDPETGKRTCE